MIQCSDFLAEIGNLLDGDVAAELRVHLEEHLAHCKACQVVYDSTTKTVRVVTESGSFDLPQPAVAPLTEQIMAKIRGSQPPK